MLIDQFGIKHYGKRLGIRINIFAEVFWCHSQEHISKPRFLKHEQSLKK